MVTEQSSGSDDPARTPASDRIVVQLHVTVAVPPEALERQAAALAARLPGGRVVRVSARGRAVLQVDRGQDVTAAAAELADDPSVVYAEPDSVDRAV